MSYVTFTFMGFRLLSCRTLDDKMVLQDAPSVECFRGAHIMISLVAMILTAIFSCLIPAFIYYKLSRIDMGNIRSLKSTKMRERSSNLQTEKSGDVSRNSVFPHQVCSIEKQEHNESSLAQMNHTPTHPSSGTKTPGNVQSQLLLEDVNDLDTVPQPKSTKQMCTDPRTKEEISGHKGMLGEQSTLGSSLGANLKSSNSPGLENEKWQSVVPVPNSQVQNSGLNQSKHLSLSKNEDPLDKAHQGKMTTMITEKASKLFQKKIFPEETTVYSRQVSTMPCNNSTGLLTRTERIRHVDETMFDYYIIKSNACLYECYRTKYGRIG